MNVQGVIQGDAAPQPVVFFAGLLDLFDVMDDGLGWCVGFDDLQSGGPPKGLMCDDCLLADDVTQGGFGLSFEALLISSNIIAIVLPLVLACYAIRTSLF